MLHTSNRFFKINDLQHFSDEAAKKTIFYESTHSAGAVWCLKPGQTLPCHTHKDADDVWIVLQGKGTFFTNNNNQKTIQAGDIFVSFPGDCPWYDQYTRRRLCDARIRCPYATRL